MEVNKLQSKDSMKSGRKYSFKRQKFQEKVTFLCQFCGGDRCKQEDYKTNKIQPNAIEGLHSNWITQNILAMQRPSLGLIKKHNLYAQWKKENIITILNLQQPGEHPYCGEGVLKQTGFSYIPDQLYKHNIHFYNPSWEDMTATTCDYMMTIMDIFDYTFQRGGKIAVHCHAGRGRTLMAICGWLIYSGKCTARQSIRLAVQKREGVLTKNSQRDFLQEFQQFLKTKRRCFGVIIKMPFETLIERHQQTLLKRQKSKCKNISYIQLLITEQIINRLKASKISIDNLVGAIKGEGWNTSKQKQLKNLKNMINQIKGDFKQIQQYDTQILTECLFDYFDQMAFNPVDAHSCEKMQAHKKEKQLINVIVDPQIIHSVGSYVLCTILSFMKFLTQLKALMASNSSLDVIINRIVMCLVVRKKYNKQNFDGRFMKGQVILGQNENYLKQLFIDGLAHQFNQQKFDELERIIRKKNVEILYHKNSLKESRKRQYLEQKQMKQLVYKKVK